MFTINTCVISRVAINFMNSLFAKFLMIYCKVSHLESHAGFLKLLMKGISDSDVP